MVVLGLLLVFSGLGWWSLHVWPAARDIYQAGKDLQALGEGVRAWPTRDQRTRVLHDVHVLDARVTELVRLHRPIYPLLRRLRILPYVGATIAALPDMLEAGRTGLHGGRLLLDVLLPALPSQKPTALTDLSSFLLQRVAAQDTSLAEAEIALDKANTYIQRVPSQALLPPLQPLVQRAQTWASYGGDGVAMLRLAPSILGEGEHTWLLLALNNEELRPTGGFISAVGVLRTHHGAIEDITFEDSYASYSPDHTYPLAPASMRRTLNVQLLLLRDANWWPDGPTSARMVAQFYQKERHVAVEGVISFDLDALQLIVDGLGGIRVGPDQTLVTGETLRPYLYKAWANPSAPSQGSKVYGPGWWKERKRFIRVLKDALLATIFRHPGDVPWRSFIQKSMQALRERHITIVPISDERAQRIVARRGWDAAIRPGQGDYLRVTDTNVGFNKANAKVRLYIAYTVDLRSSPVESRLILTYTHTSQAPIVRCFQVAYYGETYEEMQDRCYWNYLRVERAAGTEVLSVEGLDKQTLTIGYGDAGTHEVAGLMTLLPRHTHTVLVRERLPGRVFDSVTYTLRVQKQPGTQNIPFTLRVRTAQGVKTFTTTLTTDIDITYNIRNQHFSCRSTYPLSERMAK